MTPEEWIMWDILRGPHCSFKFRRQQQIGPYIVDFYCSELKLVIEADGGQHGGPSDQKRDHFLQQEGIFVLRFWNNDITQNKNGVWDKISTTIDDLKNTPRITPARTIPTKISS